MFLVFGDNWECIWLVREVRLYFINPRSTIIWYLPKDILLSGRRHGLSWRLIAVTFDHEQILVLIKEKTNHLSRVTKF